MQDVIDKIVSAVTNIIIQPLIYLFIGLSFFYFFWGLAIFMLNGDEEKKREEGKQHMIWGGIGLLIISGVWGILNLINSTAGSILG